MSTDEQTVPPGPGADVCPLPDLGEVPLATLADHADPRLAARVEALLRHPEALDETWAGTTDSEPLPSPTGGFRSNPLPGPPRGDDARGARET
ncbi:hypothetical protein [Streptomyces sp. JJ38]|uniref:hypothetical protein n=1 Tax=Streptomyces sp. JJ38 TaxID=2738128 RepID=UPI001C592394|nr:hypothetical protein [Streptomyces sp. JJ38]MBW1597173.1 hypothetical protein [Streptomyces sp. JJ38]